MAEQSERIEWRGRVLERVSDEYFCCNGATLEKFDPDDSRWKATASRGRRKRDRVFAAAAADSNNRHGGVK